MLESQGTVTLQPHEWVGDTIEVTLAQTALPAGMWIPVWAGHAPLRALEEQPSMSLLALTVPKCLACLV